MRVKANKDDKGHAEPGEGVKGRASHPLERFSTIRLCDRLPALAHRTGRPFVRTSRLMHVAPTGIEPASTVGAIVKDAPAGLVNRPEQYRRAGRANQLTRPHMPPNFVGNNMRVAQMRAIQARRLGGMGGGVNSVAYPPIQDGRRQARRSVALAGNALSPP